MTQETHTGVPYEHLGGAFADRCEACHLDLCDPVHIDAAERLETRAGGTAMNPAGPPDKTMVYLVVGERSSSPDNYFMCYDHEVLSVHQTRASAETQMTTLNAQGRYDHIEIEEHEVHDGVFLGPSA